MKKYTRFVFTNIVGLWNGSFMMTLHNPYGQFVNVEEIEHIETINNYCAIRCKDSTVLVLIDNMNETYLKNYIRKYKELWKVN